MEFCKGLDAPTLKLPFDPNPEIPSPNQDGSNTKALKTRQSKIILVASASRIFPYKWFRSMLFNYKKQI